MRRRCQVSALVEELDANIDFKAAGLRAEDFDAIIGPTLASGSTKHNPRPVDKASVCEFLVELMG